MLLLDRTPVVSADELLADALGEKGVGRALVLDDGRISGLLSVSDIERVLRLPVGSQRRRRDA